MSDKHKKLDNQGRAFLNLCERSPKKDGWSTVSVVIWPLAVENARKYPELFELIEVGTSGIIRLTKEAEIILKWT